MASLVAFRAVDKTWINIGTSVVVLSVIGLAAIACVYSQIKYRDQLGEDSVEKKIGTLY